jgi:hypothetical protein
MELGRLAGPANVSSYCLGRDDARADDDFEAQALGTSRLVGADARGRQCVDHPPSTGRVWPVTKEDAPESR